LIHHAAHSLETSVAPLKLILILSVSFAICGRGLADDCPSTAALGTSRTIVVDPTAHSKVGTMSYEQTLPLSDKEVVLTFDDGPVHPYTEKILDILASECVRATFFIVGRMAEIHPELIRRAVEEGHTIGTHSMSHPLRFRALDQQRARQEIDDGIAAATTALGDPSKLSPFFRFPGFGSTDAAEEYLESRHMMVWSADFPADDWRRIGPSDVAHRALSRLESKGKGILLLHDIHKRTVEALPILFEQLKAHGFRIVHVVPVSPDLSETQTTADAWHPAWRPKDATVERSTNESERDPTGISSLESKMAQTTRKGMGGRKHSVSARLGTSVSPPRSGADIHVVP
jgi:peptidoglycan/xylan/chitin deacetylase (PgdA/CDA1 family)